MDLRKLVGIRERVSDTEQSARKRNEKEALAKAFKGTISRVGDGNKKLISTLTRKIKDQQEQAEEYKELLASFKDQNEEMASKLVEVSKQFDELKNYYNKFKLEYDSNEGTLKIGNLSQDATFDEFTSVLNVLSVIMPNLLVKLEVENVEEPAEKVKDSIHSTWTKEAVKDFCESLDSYCAAKKPIDYQEAMELANKYGTVYLINKVSALENAEDLASATEEIKGLTELNRVEDAASLSSVAELLENYINEYDPSYLSQIDVSSLPENLSKIVSNLKREGFLSEDFYETYAPGAKKELQEAGVSVPSFAMLKDARTMNLTDLKKKLKELGIMDSVWRKIPGVPSKFRVADSAKATAGFDRPQVLKEGKVFIIYQ